MGSALYAVHPQRVPMIVVCHPAQQEGVHHRRSLLSSHDLPGGAQNLIVADNIRPLYRLPVRQDSLCCRGKIMNCCKRFSALTAAAELGALKADRLGGVSRL